MTSCCKKSVCQQLVEPQQTEPPDTCLSHANLLLLPCELSYHWTWGMELLQHEETPPWVLLRVQLCRKRSVIHYLVLSFSLPRYILAMYRYTQRKSFWGRVVVVVVKVFLICESFETRRLEAEMLSEAPPTHIAGQLRWTRFCSSFCGLCRRSLWICPWRKSYCCRVMIRGGNLWDVRKVSFRGLPWARSTS